MNFIPNLAIILNILRPNKIYNLDSIIILNYSISFAKYIDIKFKIIKYINLSFKAIIKYVFNSKYIKQLYLTCIKLYYIELRLVYNFCFIVFN